MEKRAIIHRIILPERSYAGGRYNPTTLTNVRARRYEHTAVWAGDEMIVWGGWDSTSVFNTGGRYCAHAPNPPNLGADTLVLDGSEGNANGVWGVGEAAAIEPAWANIGSTDAPGVTVSVTSIDPITDGAATYGTIPAGGTQDCVTAGVAYNGTLHIGDSF